MSIIKKRYIKLIKELFFVNSELEYINESLKDAHSNFERYYQQYCEDNNIPLEKLNKDNENRLQKVYPKNDIKTDSEGIVESEKPKGRDPGKNSKKIFVKMYRSLTSKIHPDKFANRDITPEIEEKISYFKSATKSYNESNWANFLEVCDRFGIIPTRYDSINETIANEISEINKEIVQKRRMFSWRLFECEDNANCKDKVIEEFLLQLFNYKVTHVIRIS